MLRGSPLAAPAPLCPARGAPSCTEHNIRPSSAVQCSAVQYSAVPPPLTVDGGHGVGAHAHVHCGKGQGAEAGTAWFQPASTPGWGAHLHHFLAWREDSPASCATSVTKHTCHPAPSGGIPRHRGKAERGGPAAFPTACLPSPQLCMPARLPARHLRCIICPRSAHSPTRPPPTRVPDLQLREDLAVQADEGGGARVPGDAELQLAVVGQDDGAAGGEGGRAGRER